MEKEPQKESEIVVFFTCGKFLIWDHESVKLLRYKHVLASHVGVDARLPCLLSHYAARLIAQQNFASSFKLLRLKHNQNALENELKFSQIAQQLTKVQSLDYVAKRTEEMQTRGVEITDSRLARIGSLRKHQVKITLPKQPDPSFSSHDTQNLTKNQVLVLTKVDLVQYKVYLDLWTKGYYLGSGEKFGAEYLAYSGDPVMYHAEYAVRCLSSLEQTITSKNFQICDINAFQRLCNATHKRPLLAVVHNNDSDTIDYFTLPIKEFVSDISIKHLEKIQILKLSPDNEHVLKFKRNKQLTDGVE